MHQLDRKIVWAIILTATALTCACATVQANPGAIIQLLPGDLRWNSNPKLHGLQTVTLAGDPGLEAPYAERIKIPAHFRIEPHWHPNKARMVTVLSGTLYFAFGDQFDETKLKALPAGSFFTEPANMAHYAATKEETLLQLNAMGPAGTTVVQDGGQSRLNMD